MTTTDTITQTACTCCDDPSPLFMREDMGVNENGVPLHALCFGCAPAQVYTYSEGAGYIRDATKKLDGEGNIVDNIAGEESADSSSSSAPDYTSDDDEDGGLPSPSGGAKVDLTRDDFYGDEEWKPEIVIRPSPPRPRPV